MTPAETLETGMRVPLVVLWVTLVIRICLDSWSVTEKPPRQRVRAWKWYRAAIIVMGVAVAGFYSPARIMLSMDVVERVTFLWLTACGSVLNVASVILFLTGLDVSTKDSSRGVFAYVLCAITAPFALYYL